ncbi:MAG: hypothetical protein U1E74_05760 [Paenacidovorax caeni]
MATRSVTNEFLTATGFSTDWVFSMPTPLPRGLDYTATGCPPRVPRRCRHRDRLG